MEHTASPPEHSSAALLAWEAMTLKALYLIYFSIPAIEMFALIRPSKLPSTDELSGDFLLFFFFLPILKQLRMSLDTQVCVAGNLKLLLFHSTGLQAVYSEF